MTVSQEIKSQLAKLLATEDLVVENKNVETAYFNVQTRVLTLPNWKTTNSVYDLLVGHEVGHALFTPNIDWSVDRNIPPQFVNVVEDARIEKLMKRKYPGLSKTFWKGYGQLADEDFFNIENEDVANLNLADRANLYFKIGNFIDIEFTDDEQTIMDMIFCAETFEQVLNAAEELYKYCMEQKEKQSQINFDQHAMPGDSEEQGEESEESEERAPMQSEGDGENESTDDSEPELQTTQGMGGGESADPDVQTMSSFEESIRDLAEMSTYENVYVELPKVNLKEIIIPNDIIHNNCNLSWDDIDPVIFEKVDQEYQDFKRNAKKEVNYLVKEFECRKSASAYARASTARTGVLDCSKLHTYKYNEDLFRKVTTFAEGKNHGLVFVLDWSGSMADVLMDTMKQLFNLVWFCNKVNIPFDVYAFTNEFPRGLITGHTGYPELSYEKRDGLVQVREYFSLMNVLTSSVKTKELEKQLLNMFRLAKYFSSSYGMMYNCPIGMGLSGTPLNESLIALREIIPAFRSKHNVEKVQCVVLTDGEAPPLKYHKLFENRSGDEPYIGTNSLGHNSFIRDRKTGNTYSLDTEWYNHTNILLRILRDSMPTVNFIGMRVLSPRDAAPFMRMYSNGFDAYDNLRREWKKNKSFSILNSGYHKYFGLSSNALNQSGEFEVSDNASKGQIKQAFARSLKSKKMNKKVLSEFMELIA